MCCRYRWRVPERSKWMGAARRGHHCSAVAALLQPLHVPSFEGEDGASHSPDDRHFFFKQTAAARSQRGHGDGRRDASRLPTRSAAAVTARGAGGLLCRDRGDLEAMAAATRVGTWTTGRARPGRPAGRRPTAALRNLISHVATSRARHRIKASRPRYNRLMTAARALRSGCRRPASAPSQTAAAKNSHYHPSGCSIRNARLAGRLPASAAARAVEPVTRLTASAQSRRPCPTCRAWSVGY